LNRRLLTLLCAVGTAHAAPDFAREVLPLLDTYCFDCHGDEAKPKEDGEPDVEQLNDWMTLNETLGDTAKTLAWWDAAHAKLASRPELAEALETRLVPLLVAAERWANAGALYRDPRATLKWQADLTANMRVIASPEGAVLAASGASMAALAPHLQPSRVQQEKLRTTAAQLVRALRAANRTADADGVVQPAAGRGPGLVDGAHPGRADDP